jgi:ribosome-binding protein aMBF1 (putative translation factor)
MGIVNKTACPICGAGLGCSCQLIKGQDGVVTGCSKCAKPSPPSPQKQRTNTQPRNVKAVPQQWWKTR